MEKEKIKKLEKRLEDLAELYFEKELDKEVYRSMREKTQRELDELRATFKAENPRKNNKKKGVKTGNYACTAEDLTKIMSYMRDNEMWLNELHIVLQFSTGRRVGDILNLRWFDILNIDGSFRQKSWPICEQKTKKEAILPITESMREVVQRYARHLGLSLKELVSYSDERQYIFFQWTGTHQGKVVSQAAINGRLKKTAIAVGIEQNVTTHSLRRGFGRIIWNKNNQDPNCIYILMEIFNHSSPQMTKKYLGITDEEKDKYVTEVSDKLMDCLFEIEQASNTTYSHDRALGGGGVPAFCQA